MSRVSRRMYRPLVGLRFHSLSLNASYLTTKNEKMATVVGEQHFSPFVISRATKWAPTSCK